MEVKEIKKFFGQDVEIEVNSKYPAGQGYSPVIIHENHLNISLNGHRVNISESAFTALLEIFEKFGQNIIEQAIEVVEEKVIDITEEIKEEITETIEELQAAYERIFSKIAPPRYKNDKEWLKKEISK